MHYRTRALVAVAACGLAFMGGTSAQARFSQDASETGGKAPITPHRMVKEVADSVTGALDAPRSSLSQITRRQALLDMLRSVGDGTKSVGFRWPIKGAINTPFSSDHSGIDIEGETGDPIAAAASGTVVFAGDDGDGYGLKVVIRHGDGTSTLYSHLSRIAVQRGPIAGGRRVGAVGCTGSCTGDHLHFEVLKNSTPVNPVTRLPR